MRDLWARWKRGEVKWMGTFSALLAGVVGGLGPVFQKYGMPGLEFNPIHAGDWAMVLLNGWWVLGSAFGILSMFVLVVAFSYGKAAVLFPLSGGTGFVSCFLAGSLMLGEPITWLKLLGAAILTVGIYALGKAAS